MRKFAGALYALLMQAARPTLTRTKSHVEDRPVNSGQREIAALPTILSRRALGVLVVVSVMILQGSADYVAGRGFGRILFLSFELPVLMLALSSSYAWSLRRHATAVQSLSLGMAIATVLGCVFGVLFYGVSERFPDMKMHFPSTAVASFPRSALFGVLSAQLYFGLWTLAFVFPDAVESARVRTLEAKQLRSEAELAHLRAHLEPHFLLNTLNTIAGLVTEDPREARRLIVCLGDLLRDAVQEKSELQRFDRQITWLRRYAEILEARHRTTLHFEWRIDPSTESMMLPRMLLQPLVENAVKHGALRRADGAGQVTVHASREDDGTLVCIVEDNGPGIGEEAVRQGAFGLQSVRRRLELGDGNASLDMQSSSSGTKSIVRIPIVKRAMPKPGAAVDA
jgi:signal transduction histidine kinase